MVAALTAVAAYLASEAAATAAGEYIVESILADGIIGAAAEAVGGSVLVGAASLVAGGAAAIGVQALGAALSGPQSVAQQSTVSQGILANTSGTIDPINVIYGRRTVGGTLVFAQASGAYNQNLNLVLVLGEGEILGVQTIYLDGVATTDPKFKARVYTEVYTGTDTQAASAYLGAACPNWDATHTLSGCAYVYVQLVFDPAVFRSVPKITCDVYGCKVYDPRTGAANWSSNPAVCIRDYLTNTRYGRGIPAAQIDDASFIAAANACDVLTFIGASGGVTPSLNYQATYSMNGIVNVDQPPLQNLTDMLTCCRGFLIYSGGLFKLRLDLPNVAGFDFNESNIIGKWSIALPKKQNRANRVAVTYFDSANNFQPNIATFDSTTYRAQDNGVLLEQTFALPYTSDVNTAQRIAELACNQSRKQTMVTFTSTIAALAVEVADLVTITHSTPGWSGKIFRVMQLNLLATDEVEVTAIEYDSAVYNLSQQSAVSPNPGTLLPNLDTVAAPIISVTSGTAALLVTGDGSIVSRIMVAWTPPANIFATQAEVQMRLSSGGAWATVARPSAADGTAYLSPVMDGVQYDVRVRFINTYQIASAWATAVGHQVVGKTAPPSNVADFVLNGSTLSWPPVTDIDLAGYRIKFQYGVNYDWGSATSLTTGLIGTGPFTVQTPLNGTVTLMIRAVDTTGNESVASTSIVTNFGGPVVANVVSSFDFGAAGYPGTTTNATASAGVLTSTQSDPFYSTDTSGFFGLDPNPFYSTKFDGFTWVSTGWVPAIVGAGSNLTLAQSCQGDGLQIQYRPTGPQVFFGQDAALFYGSDTDNFYSGAGVWMTWPGSIPATSQEYQFQVTTISGPDVGKINAFVAQVDLPDIRRSVANVSLSAAGSRVPIPAGVFTAITNVQATLQAGTPAITVKTLDKSPALGPLLQAFDASGAAVAATVDTTLQGY